MGEHDAAAAHPDRLGVGCDLADEYLRGSPGKATGVVMFSDPVALVAQLLRYLGKLHRLLEGLPHCPSLADR